MTAGHIVRNLTVWLDDLELWKHRNKIPTEAVGAALLLWSRAYDDNGRLPTDEATLIDWADVKPKAWAAWSPKLIASWGRERDEYGVEWYVVRRVREQLSYVGEKSSARKLASTKGNHVRWHASQPDPDCPWCNVPTGSQSESQPDPNRIAPLSPLSDPIRSVPDPIRTDPLPYPIRGDGGVSDPMAGYHPDFERFWDAYPKHAKKGYAWQVWRSHRPPIEAVLTALSWQRASTAWAEESGRYIPEPANWLSARAWEDDESGYQGKGTRNGTGADAAIREILADRNAGRSSPPLRELPAPDSEP